MTSGPLFGHRFGLFQSSLRSIYFVLASLDLFTFTTSFPSSLLSLALLDLLCSFNFVSPLLTLVVYFHRLSRHCHCTIACPPAATQLTIDNRQPTTQPSPGQPASRHGVCG
jgi:hypothetical protein